MVRRSRFGTPYMPAWRSRSFFGVKKGIDVQFLRHDADRGGDVARILVEIDAPDRDLARGFDHQLGHDVDQGGLAGAVRAEQAENLATRDVEIDMVQRQLRFGTLLPVAFHQAANRDGHLGQTRVGGVVGHGSGRKPSF